jgi:hypothetical protein
MSNAAKEREFIALYEECGGEIPVDKFIAKARKPTSAFHEELFGVNDRDAAMAWRRKKAISLIRYWSAKVNTDSAAQHLRVTRLHPVTVKKGKHKNVIMKRVERMDGEERQARIALIWRRLAGVVRDAREFPECEEIVKANERIVPNSGKAEAPAAAAAQ